MNFLEESEIIPNGSIVRVVWGDELEYNCSYSYEGYSKIIPEIFLCTIVYNLNNIKQYVNNMPKRLFKSLDHSLYGVIGLSTRPLMVVNTYMCPVYKDGNESHRERWYQAVHKEKTFWIRAEYIKILTTVCDKIL